MREARVANAVVKTLGIFGREITSKPYLPATQSVGRVAEIASNPPDRLLSEVDGILRLPRRSVKLIVLIRLIM
jgi:hypothetical protein